MFFPGIILRDVRRGQHVRLWSSRLARKSTLWTSRTHLSSLYPPALPHKWNILLALGLRSQVPFSL
jgi:hypothetical protein